MIDNGRILPDAGASFEVALPEITPMSPASGDTFNPIYQQLLNNVVVIKQAVEVVTEAHEQIKQLVQQVETTSAEAGQLAQEKLEKIEQAKAEVGGVEHKINGHAETTKQSITEQAAQARTTITQAKDAAAQAIEAEAAAKKAQSQGNLAPTYAQWDVLIAEMRANIPNYKQQMRAICVEAGNYQLLNCVETYLNN